MIERIGKYTLNMIQGPIITGFAGVAGKKESEGPFGKEFDYIFEDTSAGENSWEKAESAFLTKSVSLAMQNAGKKKEELDFLLSGDLLNQCIGTTFGLRDFNIPTIGLYGACSTMGLSLSIAAILVESGAARICGAATSSHFCSAERQFRYPLEYGGQRTPTAQWTVSGAGCSIVEAHGKGPRISAVSIGKICDYGIKDSNNMGAAMAPAAASTIDSFLKDTNTKPLDYDMILTGDLGFVGSELLIDLLKKEKIDISSVHKDCGIMIYDREKQDVHAGGSGCGCSGCILNSVILKQIKEKKLKKVLFVATGALMSSTSAQQGESIPAIAHAVEITA